MGFLLKRLSLGIALITLASFALLASDSSWWRGQHKVPRVAIVQHASTPVLEDGVRGMVAGLAQRGYIDGKTISLSYYNAEGDITTGNTIAQDVVHGGFDLVLTSSTPSMQTLANANKDGLVMHVFGLVADPFSAGVGLEKDQPLHHPRHLVGLGTFSPVADAFKLARRCLPTLKSVGVVWNPAESNSQAFTKRAREVCKEMGIELLEANADNASGVQDACAALISRGAQAIWVGGDNTVNSALDVLLASARRGGIPAFSILPGKPDRGTFFDVGNDFVEVGVMTGQIAGDILKGADPATIEVRDVSEVVPVRIIVNLRVLDGLKETWQVPDDVLQKADAVVDAKGIRQKEKRAK